MAVIPPARSRAPVTALRRARAPHLVLALAVAISAAGTYIAATAQTAQASVATPQPVAGTMVLSGVACTSGSSCLAVGQGPAGEDALVPITNGAAGSPTVGADHVTLNRVACTSASSCVAVGNNEASGEGVLVPISGGALGPAQPVPGTGALNDVACDPSGGCVAVGHTPGPPFSSEGVVVPITGGTPGAAQVVTSTQNLQGVSCPASGSCVSVGLAFEFFGQGVAFHGVVVPIEGGVAQTPTPAQGTFLLSSVDCTAPETCSAAGFSEFFGLAAVPVINGKPGTVQSTPDVPTSAEIGIFPSALACPSAQLCLAAGGDNDQLIGAVAPIVGGTPGIGQDVSGSFGLLGDLACPPASSCVAVGQTSGGAGAVLSFAPGSSASASTTVSMEPTAAQFGKPVTVAVTVSSPAGTPSGQVYYALDGVFGDYPQALDSSGKTSFAMNGLAPGSHSLTAAYLGPTGAFSPGGTIYQPGSASASNSVACNVTITGQQKGNLSISRPASCVTGATVSGSINVAPGASLSIASSSINNSINANGAGVFRMCGSTLGNALNVTNATGYVLVGDRTPGEDFDGCAANTIRGSMKLTGDSAGVTAIANTAGSVNLTGDSGRGGFPFELAPALAPNTLSNGQSTFLAGRQNGAKGQTVDGIQCNGNEQLVSHYHAHLAIFSSGQPLAVPQGIGMVGPLFEEPTPYGPFVFPESGPEQGGCIYWVHTHDQTGMIHMELPAEFTVTLGDFFDLWGQPLSAKQVGPKGGTVTAYVNGVRFTGNPRNIVLGDHTLVQLDIGGPLVPPQPFQFTATNR